MKNLTSHRGRKGESDKDRQNTLDDEQLLQEITPRIGKTGWKQCRECGRAWEKASWNANRRTDRKDPSQNAGNGEIDDPSRALFKRAYVAAKETGLQMLADNIAATHPFVREEPSETEQAHVAYPIAAQRPHKLQGQREKLVNQLVTHGVPDPRSVTPCPCPPRGFREKCRPCFLTHRVMVRFSVSNDLVSNG